MTDRRFGSPQAPALPAFFHDLPPTLFAAVALHVVFTLVTWFVPPAMNSDSATGFYVWDSWRAGAPWNHMIAPDSADISRDTSFFQAWWSPGQYLVTAPWQLLGLSLGHAIALGGGVATALALIGFYRLYRTFGFSASVAGWAVLAVACNWTLTRTYGDYLGGETALLAVLPWLVLALHRVFAGGTNFAWIAVPAIFWLGAMAKNSFVPVAAGLIAGFRGLRVWGSPWLTAAKLAEVARWAAWFGLGYLLFWATYLRLGVAPGLGFGGPIDPDWWISALRVLGFPLSSIFSLSNVLGRVFQHPSHPLVASVHALWPLYLLIALGGTVVLVRLLKQEFLHRPAWARLLVGVVVANLAFYGCVLLWRSAGGLEERFFKPVGFLLLPSLIATLHDSRPPWPGKLLCLLLALSSAYGVGSFANRAHYLTRLANEGRRGTTQNVLSREGLSVLHTLDTTLPPSSLIVVPSPEMTLELQRVRRLSTHAVMMDAAQLAAERRDGRAENLVVLVDERMLAAGQARALLDSFTDYPPSAWTAHRYGTWIFYHQGPFAAWPAPTGVPQ